MDGPVISDLVADPVRRLAQELYDVLYLIALKHLGHSTERRELISQAALSSNAQLAIRACMEAEGGELRALVVAGALGTALGAVLAETAASDAEVDQTIAITRRAFKAAFRRVRAVQRPKHGR